MKVDHNHVHTVHSPKGSETSATERERARSESSSRSGAGVEGGTRPEISARGRELAHAKDVAGKAPDVREEKIAKLKAMIASDQYKIDPHAVADRLVDEHLSSGIG